MSADEETCIAVREYENWLPGELKIFWGAGTPCVQQHPSSDAPAAVAETAAFSAFTDSVLMPLVEEMGSSFVVTDIVMDS